MLLDGIVENMAGDVAMGVYGDFSTHDNKAGYYIVKLTSVPYTLQENFNVYGSIIESGELVCDSVYLYPLDYTSWNRDTPEYEDTQYVTVNLRKVLHPQLDMNVAQ